MYIFKVIYQVVVVIDSESQLQAACGNSAHVSSHWIRFQLWSENVVADWLV